MKILQQQLQRLDLMRYRHIKVCVLHSKCEKYYHHSAVYLSRFHPVGLQARATYWQWRRDLHSDVIGVEGGVQPRPLVRWLTVWVAFSLPRLWLLALGSSRGLRLQVLTILQHSTTTRKKHKTSEWEFGHCRNLGEMINHLIWWVLPQLHAVHAIPLCKFGSRSYGKKLSRSKQMKCQHRVRLQSGLLFPPTREIWDLGVSLSLEEGL